MTRFKPSTVGVADYEVPVTHAGKHPVQNLGLAHRRG